MFDHPLHPIMVHFTIALTIASIFCYILGQMSFRPKIKSDLQVSSFWMLLLASIATIFTLISGYLQFNSVAHDGASHAAMVNHRYWGIASASLLFILCAWFITKYRKNNFSGKLFPLLLIGLAACIANTAYKGGNLVYKFGLGVKSTPEMRSKAISSKKENRSAPYGHEGHNHDH
jgi:uncharacterized membrane protein